MQNGESPSHSVLIVLPSERPEVGRSLQHSFGDDASVHLIADRRRRVRDAARQCEPDRRRQSHRDAELEAGRWIVVPLASRTVDFSDPDARAILFLCCGEHVVACQTCQDTYRLGWVRRTDPGAFACPRCGSDLTAAAAAHTVTCMYWVGRGAKESGTAVAPREERTG